MNLENQNNGNAQRRFQGDIDKRFDHLIGWKVFRLFILVKPTCAIVLDKIVTDGGFPQGCPNAISPGAVKKELRILMETRKELKKLRKTGSAEGFDGETLFCKEHGRKMRYTFVQHSVGMHIDVFTGGGPSLENRMCFAVKRGKGDDTGRGTGLGMEKFGFAILDW